MKYEFESAFKPAKRLFLQFKQIQINYSKSPPKKLDFYLKLMAKNPQSILESIIFKPTNPPFATTNTNP